MDIAKIRKKAREKEEEKKAAEERKEPSEGRLSGPSEARTEEADAIRKEPDDVADSAGGYPEEEHGPFPKTPETGAVAVPPEETIGESPEPEEIATREVGNVLELLAFSVCGKEFAFRIADVEEIIPFQGITAVPLLPDYVSGIMSLRGKIIPVVDLKRRFSLAQSVRSSASSAGPEAYGRKEKILILSGPKGLIGAIADRIKGVLRFPESSVLAPPAHLNEDERRFIEGVVIMEKRFISIVRFGDTMNIEVG